MKLNFSTFFVQLVFLSSLSQVYGQLGEQKAIPWTGKAGITESLDIINQRQKAFDLANPVIIPRDYERKHKEVERDRLRQNPLAPKVSAFPMTQDVLNSQSNRAITAAQTIGTNFNSASLAETGSFPPDNMGAVGPTQFITSVNGRLKSFNKSTGVADGILNLAQDVFFASVMTPAGGGVTFSFTSDPRVRYDRKNQKWIFIIIDVPCTNGTCTTTAANRVLIAVSNGPNITSSSAFTFFYFVQDQVTPTGDIGGFIDYPTLGIDDNALYIGGNMFSSVGSFIGTSGFVVRKSSILGAGPIVVSAFRSLATASGEGPFTPQGVDNLDATSTNGYFIGVDNLNFSKLMVRRITDPGGTPTISANISLTVPSTTSPKTIPHLGNTGGTNGNLDALDDRLYAAVQRNGHLWTAHSFRVSTAGVANTTASSRNGVRWYDITNLATTPTLTQSGTVFDAAATNPIFYNNPSIMVSGQGHAVVGMTSAGAANRINASTTGRLASDALGTMGAIVNTTASATAYNPVSDPGGAGGRRWGDYSFVSLDPIDDQTMWMIHQFCDANNSYGCQVTQLKAPPPATPATCVPASVPPGLTSVLVTVTGTAVSGSGFYDPGANLAGAIPFNHISALVSGGVVVNSITYTDATHITLDLNTVAAPIGNKTITVTNPDGQSITSGPVLAVACPTRLYVDASKTGGSNNGSSWANAYTSLSAALNNSCAAFVSEIWVAKGTYKPTGANGDRSLKFTIPTNVKVYGGFAGDEVLLTDRKFDFINTTNKTSLSGDLNGDDLPNFVNNAENSYTIVNFSSASNNTVLDGFTIAGANNNSGATATGGGISSSGSDVKINNCVIAENFANFNGGGFFNQSGSPTVFNCKFIKNKAANGAALANVSTAGTSKTMDLSNSVFLSNNASTTTGAIMFNDTKNASSNLQVNVTNCSFYGNTAAAGAGIYNWAETAGNILNVTLKNSAFYNNGGSSTFLNEPTSAGTATIISTYGLFDNTVTGYTGTNNITANALPFLNADDAHLPCASPAINSGTNTSVPPTDLDGNPRPFNGGIADIGAYEKQETMTWLGYTADWADAANWSGKMVPSACTNVIVNAGTPFMPIVNGLDNVCLSLTANNGANVKVNDGAKLTILQ